MPICWLRPSELWMMIYKSNSGPSEGGVPARTSVHGIPLTVNGRQRRWPWKVATFPAQGYLWLVGQRRWSYENTVSAAQGYLWPVGQGRWPYVNTISAAQDDQIWQNTERKWTAVKKWFLVSSGLYNKTLECYYDDGLTIFSNVYVYVSAMCSLNTFVLSPAYISKYAG